MMRILLCFLLWVGAFVAHASGDINMKASTTKPSFVVTLAANPTTGYQWAVVSYDKNLFSLSSSKYIKPQTNLIGSGGQMVYTFILNKGKTYPKKTNLLFKY